VDRRHETNDWSSDIDSHLDRADRVLALVTRNVVESPRDFVFAEMFVAREHLKLVALQIGEMRLPYKYLSIMLGLNRRAFRTFQEVLQNDSLEDLCAACGSVEAGQPSLDQTEPAPLRGPVSAADAALAVATAMLEELPVTTVVDAAADLENRLQNQLGAGEAPRSDLFRSRGDRLRDIGAFTFEIMHPQLQVPVRCVRFADPQRRFALLEYAWDELDGMRESLIGWLDAWAASRDPDVRTSIGLVVGVLARTRFATVLNDVLARWALSADAALRDVADLAFRVALDERSVEHAVGTQIQEWARSRALAPVRAAIELACGYTGSRLPRVGIETLKIVAKAKLPGVNAVSLMQEGIAYLAAANKEASDGSLFDLSHLLAGLCAWVEELLPRQAHEILPLVLFFELIKRLPIRAPKGVPGVLSMQAIIADAEMAQAVTRIFDIALRTGGGASARDLARDCLKVLCRATQGLVKHGRLHDDPVLALVRAIYAASPSERDRDRLAYTVARTYTRDQLEAGGPAAKLSNQSPVAS
jgi:hypothetical protein